jgi:hypothetical protein
MPAVQYDDRAAAFFGIAVLTVFAVPSAAFIARAALTFRADEGAVAAKGARSRLETERLERRARARPARVLWTPAMRVWAAATAAALAVLVALVLSMRNTTLAPYDPFAILGIAAGATDREIKSAYRTLSRTHHPDKGGDSETFQKISKAYEALTDPVARENWEKFGNPDGKGALEVAIGIPSALLHPKARYVFMLGYLGLLVLACVAMRRVWQSTKGKTIHNLLQPSINHVVARMQMLRTNTLFARKVLPETYASMEDLVGPGGIKYEQADLIENGEIPSLGQKLSDPKSPRIFFTNGQDNRPLVTGVGRANTILLSAYMSRSIIDSPGVRAQLPRLLEHVPAFVRFSMLLCRDLQHQRQAWRAQRVPEGRLPPPTLELADEVALFGASCTQALYLPYDSELLQVFTEEEAAALQREWRGAKIARLLEKTPAERDALLAKVVGERGAERRDEVDRVLADMPLLRLALEFGVDMTGSVSSAAPAGGCDDCDEPHGAGAGSSAAKSGALRPTIYEGNFVTARLTIRHANLADDAAVPPVHAPHFPSAADVDEEWFIWVLDERNDVVHQGGDPGAPLLYANVRPKKGLETLVFHFPSPPADMRRLTVRARSSVYFGLDVETPARFEVRKREDEPVAPEDAAGASAADADDEDDEDEGDDRLLVGSDENMERLFANEDLSDRSDDEDEDEDKGKGAKGKGGEKDKGGDAKGAGAAASPARAAAGGRGGRPISTADVGDDGWAPSILAGAPRRARPTAEPKKGSKKGKVAKGAPRPAASGSGSAEDDGSGSAADEADNAAQAEEGEDVD